MPYIGAKELKASDIRRFDVTSSTSATHTLTWTPPTEQSLIVTINGIKQHEDAYSVSGTTLTLSFPLVATDKLEVIGINDIGTTITPAQNSVNTDKIVDDAVTAAKLNTTGTASASTFLRGDMAWATPTDQGKVLQVVNATYATQESVVGNTLTDSSLSAAITPSSTSSKIFVFISVQTHADGASSNIIQSVQLEIDRNGTAIFTSGTQTSGGAINVSSSYKDADSLTTIHYLDSPSSTSALTYKLKYCATQSSGTAFVQFGGIPSSITLMEVAG